MSKLEDTAYNYGAKIKGKAMSDISIFEAAYDAAEADCKALRAENDRLREALDKIAELIAGYDGKDIEMAWGIARDALAKEAGE